MIFGGKFEFYKFLTWGKLNKSFDKLQVIFLQFLQFLKFIRDVNHKIVKTLYRLS
jgi:hypothetical protein